MMKDKHFTSRMLTCAGALMTVSALLMAVGAGIAYGSIFWQRLPVCFSRPAASASRKIRKRPLKLRTARRSRTEAKGKRPLFQPERTGDGAVQRRTEALRSWRKTPGCRPLPGWTELHPFLLFGDPVGILEFTVIYIIMRKNK